jgi:hypothetical protein
MYTSGLQSNLLYYNPLTSTSEVLITMFEKWQYATTVKTKTSEVSIQSTANADIVNSNQYNFHHSGYLKYRKAGLILTDVYEKYFTEKQNILA